MPATLLSSLSLADDACGDCSGTGVYQDADGSVSGSVGALVPCGCSDEEFGASALCPCHMEWWPTNGGFTGWTLTPRSELSDDSTFLRPCPTHGHLALPRLAVVA
ncbi:hypothetical protein ABH931_006446 [Streptacidiphilus sp. MAP12-33]|uniref:hypothetical protein n=1 Tax=Streptacidiphilus sp. MAP12-33 TaxID=3156266 RepID=UPI00351499C2